MEILNGITREEEERKLQEIIEIAEGKVDCVKREIHKLAVELHEMQEEFDESDKEMQALWNNKDARFKEVNRELKIAKRARKKPYFGRIDFSDRQLNKEESYYIGRSVIAKDPSKPEVIDWRAPIAGVYYGQSLGKMAVDVKGEGKYTIDLLRKRTYEIENDKLKDFYDSDVVTNDDLLTKYLAKSKRNVLSEIIATIQEEQNEIIRKKPQHNLIVQGAAGSGKTTVAMHRISYILYNYEREFAPEDFYVVGSNKVLLNYITGVLPDLDVYGVTQMTMEQLFSKLLYEDYDKSFKIKPVIPGVTEAVKGSYGWFKELEMFCQKYERGQIPMEDVVLEKTGVVLMRQQEIQGLLRKVRTYSLPDKKDYLSMHLEARLENELTGKYYSYTPEEKKQLFKKYKTYFGKREWKGSIYELYEQFLEEQRRKDIAVAYTRGEGDVYDLAALAFLYKRIKEEEVIREACHVVIDEAQDFGMMVYGCLKYCLSKCTYTIMGDVAQNIFSDFGLNDWEELKMLMLPEEFDSFELLRKSYRNTVEIADFATDILYHGSFSVYPVEPILRHGDSVKLKECESFIKLCEHVEAVVRQWEKDGLETIAVLCESEEETDKVWKALASKTEILKLDEEHMQFGQGVMVLPLNLCKGLEFDGVIIFDASGDKYPKEDGSAKRLYVAATRALHRLEVCYTGELTGLIKDKVEDEKRAKTVDTPKRAKKRLVLDEPEKTREEIYRQQALEAEKEMQLRNQHGPKRILLSNPTSGAGKESTSDVKESTGNAGVRNAGDKGFGTGRSGTVGAGSTGFGNAKSETAGAGNVKLKTAGIRNTGNTVLGKQENQSTEKEFGSLPSDNSLSPAGHSKADCSIKIVMASANWVDLYCHSGILRIIPVSDKGVRVRYTSQKSFEDREEVLEEKVKFRLVEAREAVEILLKKLKIRIPRKTGAIEFYDDKGKLLLKERAREPRFTVGDRAYSFLEFDRKEALFAKGEQEEILNIGNSARYISFGRENPATPQLASSKGYEISFVPCERILCCNVAVFGPYILQENAKELSYRFDVN